MCIGKGTACDVDLVLLVILRAQGKQVDPSAPIGYFEPEKER